MSQDKFLTGSIEITKLICVKTTRKGKDGKDVEGLFIPLDINHIEEIIKKEEGKPDASTGRYILNVRVNYRPETDTYGQNGFIAKSLPSDVYKENKDNKDFLNKNQPILGNLKDWSQGRNDDVPPPPVIDESSDLPF